MKINQFFIILIVFMYSCTAKQTSTNSSQVALESLDEVAENYANSITQNDLKKHLTILASDEFEGRETAMPGQKKAASYIADFFKANSIQPGINESYLQNFPVDVKDPSKIEVKINDSKVEFLKDYFYLGNVMDTLINTEIIDVNYGIKDSSRNDYKDFDIKDKVVLIKNGIPNDSIDSKWENKRNKIKLAKELGAIGVIIRFENEIYLPQLERVKLFISEPNMQMHNKGLPRSKEIPVLYISEAFASNLKQNNSIEIHTETNQILSSDNVLGFIEGTDLKDELVIVTAHYDHLGYDNGEVCNGADDDGTGTVSVLEIAQAFQLAKNEGKGPRRSMLFMTVSGEEKGLWGSKYYTDNPVYPLENTVVDLNIDMVGRTDEHHDNSNYVYLIGADRISLDLDKISTLINNKYIHFNLDYTYNMPNDPNQFYYRSDHYNFAKNDIPVVFYFSGVHEDYHKPTDDVDKIDFEKLERTAKLVFYTAWEIANRTERIQKNALK